MTLFQHNDYREALKWSSERWKQAGGGGRTYQKLSKATGVHPPYLTNVLKQKAHLNSDQLFLASKYMGFSQPEMEFMFLLLERDKCVLAERKQALKQQLEKIRDKQEKAEAGLNLEMIAPTDDYYSKYYLDNSIRLVYGFLGVERFSQNPESIAVSLNVSEETVRHALSYLLDIGLVEKKDDGSLKKTKTKMHLPRESYLFEAQRKLFSYRCLEHQDRTRSPSDYNFGVTFTASPEVKSKIRKKFKEFLESVQPLVDEAPSQEVYQMNFDIFNWS